MTQEPTTNPRIQTENQNAEHQTHERSESPSEQSQNRTRTKIESSTHLCITIRWGGPGADAPGPDSRGDASC
jgi:hypothetical protein